MYAKDDPRSSLATAAATAPRTDAGTPIAAPQYADLRTPAAPDAAGPEGRTAVFRAQNVVLAHTGVRAGEELDNGTLEGELAVVVTEDSPAFSVHTEDGETYVDGPGLVVVPPGASRITAHGEGPLVRLVEAGERAWRERAVNAAAYAEDHPRVAPLRRWPEPVGGRAVRFYPLAEVPDEPGRFGRIFRTRAFMVNFLPPQHGPRDPRRLSPHTHEDFEQLSLAMRGTYTHHIRTPWLNDSTGWREDEHVTLGSPSLAISPPRADFSARPGWVLNADDYPMP